MYDLKDNKSSGIYSITNILNNKMYIGSAINLYRRVMRHKVDLRRNEHHNSHLQSAYNKYGKTNFTYKIIELVSDKSMLIIREQNWLDFFSPAYNQRKIAHSSLGVTFSKEIKERMSAAQKGRTFSKEARKNMSDAHKGKYFGLLKPVFQHNIEGKLLKKYNSVRECSSFFGTTDKYIYKVIHLKSIFKNKFYLRYQDAI